MKELFSTQDTIDQFLDPSLPVKTLNTQVDWILTHRKQEYTDQLIKTAPLLKKSTRTKIAKGLMALKPLGKDTLIRTWQDTESDRTIYILLQSILERLASGSLSEDEVSAQVYSVDEVIKIIKQKVGDKTYVIEGELGEYKPLPGAQVAYFNLKGAHDDAINCMVMRFLVDRLTFVLNPGLKIRVTGQFRIGKNTRLYFQINRIELTGEGELLRSLQQLQLKLEQEGLFDPTRKRPIPLYPQKILLVASPNSAALTDFLKVFRQRRGGAEIFHLPIKTQGIGAEESVLYGLIIAEKFIKRYAPDVVVLTRGGGATEELFVFNSERVVRALFALQVPTVVAIGHERDTTLAELVADLRCSTPSQAAEKSSLSRFELHQQTASMSTFIAHSVQAKYTSYQHVAAQLWLLIMRALHSAIQAIRLQSSESFQFIRSHFTRVSYELNQLIQTLTFTLKQRHYQIVCEVPSLQPLEVNLRQHVKNYQSSVNEVQETLTALDPRKVLERGYSIVFDGAQAISSAHDIEEKQSYQLQFHDGSVEMTKKEDSSKKE